MLHLHVTREALYDLVDIGLYTQERWGEAKRIRYLDGIEERFEWLRENWGLGRVRDDIRKGYYSYHHARHVIFYRVRDERLEIIGVLHERMDFERHL